jgi:hypothetical protein
MVFVLLSMLVVGFAAGVAWTIRRRIRFSMRTLLIVVTVAAVACGAGAGVLRLLGRM